MKLGKEILKTSVWVTRKQPRAGSDLRTAHIQKGLPAAGVTVRL